MIILTVNVGSSSVRLDLFDARADEPARLASAHVPADEAAASDRVQAFLSAGGSPAIGAIAHRVVHGGPLHRPVVIDDAVEAEIDRAALVAPLHNPLALAWIQACRAAVGPELPQVAVFDTAFFADLPPAAATYALPPALAGSLGLRRHGFHGLAHEAMWRRWCALRPDLPGGGRLITLQLGSGCSAAAIDRGRAVDTSMGFSPLEGLVMATRCGDLDPGVVLHLQRAAGLGPDEVETLLGRRAGLLGLSGTTGSAGELLGLATPAAELALAVYCHRLRKYVGAYLAVLGGADGIVFGGGVGENVPPVRARALAGLGALGIELDGPANEAARGSEARLDNGRRPCALWVIPVDEARLLAARSRETLASRSPR